MERRCYLCKKVFTAISREELSKIFGYKNRAKTLLLSKCRSCKKEYDRINNIKKRETMNSAKLFKDAARAETKRFYGKMQFTCAIVSCIDPGELHHIDYSKPKDVIPLCRNHHSAIHRLERDLYSQQKSTEEK